MVKIMVYGAFRIETRTFRNSMKVFKKFPQQRLFKPCQESDFLKSQEQLSATYLCLDSKPPLRK